MKYMVIKSLGLADGRSKFQGMYLKSYNPEGARGRGTFEWTADKADAWKFSDMGEIHAIWTAVPTSRPTRPDGEPNRPLTAFTITIEDA